MNHLDPSTLDWEKIRSWFAALQSDTVFLENAGGSQMPTVVADAMHHYMLNSYVQLDAGYALSTRATELVNRAHDFVGLLMNGQATGKVVLGASCSQLCRMLADCYSVILAPGDEIVVAETGHEANVGPWIELSRMGAKIKIWKVDPVSFTCPLESLEQLLTDRTRIVTFPHVSNLLGQIVNLEPIVRLVHERGAEVVVDGVAYAPHRAMDMAAWDVDWYVYSTYKVYGPHMAALYGKNEAFARLTGPNHYFISKDDVPYKFELGGSNHEGCSGLLALGAYLNFLAGKKSDDPIERKTVTDAFDRMTCCELPLQQKLIRYLLDKPQVRIIGPETFDATRVGTVSFVHEQRVSSEIARAAHKRNIGIRNGHMYAHRLCKALGFDPEDGVVRVSLLHYNTPEEIDRLIECFEETLQ